MKHAIAKVTDSQLVSQYIQGSELALSQLVARHSDDLLHFVYAKTRDEDVSQDIVQESWMKFVDAVKRGKYAEQGTFLAWIYRVARNKTMDYFRKQKRNREQSMENCMFLVDGQMDDQFNADELMCMGDMHELMWQAVQNLPDNQKEVLEMRIVAGMSFKDIAEETGVGINTALGRMRYAVINLRKQLADSV